MATGKRRSTGQTARDRKRIGELYLKGWLQVEIAAELKIDQSTVSRDLKAMQAEWLQSALVDFNEAKAKELAKIDQLELTYWEAWERSLEEFRSKTVKARGTRVETIRDGDSQTEVRSTPVEQSQKNEDRNGDPRYLQGVQWCIERRCKLLGLDSDMGSSEDKPLIIKIVKGVSSDEL